MDADSLPPVNALTIDVEDYFHVTAFERTIRRDEWDRYPLRVEHNVNTILDELENFGVKATFFVLGWVARRLPTLVPAIRNRGHEVACHGYGHERVYAIGLERFRQDIRLAKNILEDQSGTKILGYRAPSFSVTRQSLWAYDILIEEGFLYDSSVFPIRHDVYGMPDADPRPHLVTRPAGSMREFPLSTVDLRFAGRFLRIPVAGGGYLRLFPLWFISRAIRDINRQGQPAVLYFHPWEIDPGQPRIKAGIKSTFRHYNHLGKTLGKVKSLLKAFHWAPMAEVLGMAQP